MDVLVLNYEEVESILTMPMTLEALEDAYGDWEVACVVNRPRSHTYIPMSSGPEPDERMDFYLKTMEGGSRKLNVVALRINPGHMGQRRVGNTVRHEYTPTINGDKWLELIMLFRVDNGELLCIMPGGYLQKMRVGATSGLGTKYMAREDSHVLGLIGSGWQASSQVMAHCAVRPIREIKVFSLTPEHRERFAKEMEAQMGIAVRPVNTAEEAVRGSDIVACATNSHQPVMRGEWLEPGQHLTSIAVAGGEVDPEAVRRCDRIAVHQRMGSQNFWTGEASSFFVERQPYLDIEKYPELKDLISGRAVGRERPGETTYFVNTQGLGIQFAAAGYRVYQEAKKRGVGRWESWDHLLQAVHP